MVRYLSSLLHRFWRTLVLQRVPRSGLRCCECFALSSYIMTTMHATPQDKLVSGAPALWRKFLELVCSVAEDKVTIWPVVDLCVHAWTAIYIYISQTLPMLTQDGAPVVGSILRLLIAPHTAPQTADSTLLAPEHELVHCLYLRRWPLCWQVICCLAEATCTLVIAGAGVRAVLVGPETQSSMAASRGHTIKGSEKITHRPYKMVTVTPLPPRQQLAFKLAPSTPSKIVCVDGGVGCRLIQLRLIARCHGNRITLHVL